MKKSKYTKKNISFYDSWSDRYKNINLLEFDKAAKYEFEKIIEQLDLSKKRNIIEFGAGLGKHSLALAKMGHNVTAVDVSQGCLDILLKQAKKHKLEKNIKVVCHDSSSMVYKNKYDIALCISTYQVVAETERERVKILANFIAVLKPGGTFLLVEPNPFNPFLYFFYLFYPGVQRKIVKTFIANSPFRLKKIFKDKGMNDIKINYVGFLPIRFIKKSSIVVQINEAINRTPFINIFSAFSYITAIKK